MARRDADSETAAPHLAVVGGGISGLVAALRLQQALPAARIELFESELNPGGKLSTIDFAVGPVDVGAEAFVVRRPEALELVAELGLDHLLRAPAGRRPALYSGGALRSLPTAQVFGIPGDPGELGELCSDDVIARVAAEPDDRFAWRVGQDANVGELVTRQLGAEVLDRLVDPMLGGVYAASARDLGLRAVAPNLAEQLDAQSSGGDTQAAGGAEPGTASLVEAVRAVRATAVSGQVFGTLEGGYRRLVDGLTMALSVAGRASVHLGAEVVGARVRGRSVQLRVDDTAGTPTDRTFDGVVCALPAPTAAKLLREVSADAAAPLAAVRCASSAVVTCVLNPGVEVPELSGVLVAADAGRAAKALTLSSRKWAHLDQSSAGGGHVLRVSFGRLDDAAVVELPDAELFRLAREEMAAIAGIRPDVHEHRVTRWIDGLPVPGPGHAAELQVAERALAEAGVPIELAGAAMRGVGVPVCIATAEAAAYRLASRWQD